MTRLWGAASNVTCPINYIEVVCYITAKNGDIASACFSEDAERSLDVHSFAV